MLEENVAVLVGTAHSRFLWVQCMLTELFYCVHVAHFFQISVIPFFNLLDLVGSTETIEEVNKRNFSLKSSKMCYRT